MTPPVNESFPAKLFVTLVEKLALFPNAAANSLRVSSAPGAPLIKLLICVVT